MGCAMEPAMIKAVIFDVDGTLIDSVDFHARAWQQILAEYGHQIDFQTIRHQIGKGGDQLLPVFLSVEEIERSGKEIQDKRSDFFKREYLPKVRPFPMVRALFERIRRDGKQIALGSSGKKDEVERYEQIAGISDLVDISTSSDDADKSKPHPDIFLAVMEKLTGIKPNEAIVIGDTPYDAEAAGKAGLKTIGLLCGGFPEAELKAAGCVAIYRDPADLLKHYETSPIHR
jgi:HAD superfamily hydrolase (TIGR01509 family)